MGINVLVDGIHQNPLAIDFENAHSELQRLRKNEI